jgi:poly-gamma-glutamate capsule biosynthesis protein CapA/YwtB (metallophosphatase superfamily)
MKSKSSCDSRRVVVVICVAAALLSTVAPAWSQSSVTITLTGQSMIRSDLRATAPSAMPRIQALLKGDVIFTNLEGTVAETGQSVQEGRGFLTPPESLDALQSLGFNLLSLSNNHAFDMKDTGIENTLREVNRRKIVHAGTGHTLAEAAAPAYLHISNMTVALVSSASGLISSGGNATANRPGVNELRIQAGDKPNEATEDLPGAPVNKPIQEDAERILQSIRDAKQHANLVIVYQHNHVFGNKAFSTIFNEGMAERLAPK